MVSFVLAFGFDACPIYLNHSWAVDDLGVRTVSDTPSTSDGVSATTLPSQ